jgi:mRNA interferase MazF
VSPELAHSRPCLVVSADDFNTLGRLVIVVPLTQTAPPDEAPLWRRIAPPEAGVREVSHAQVDQLTAISQGRLRQRWGKVEASTLADIEEQLRIILGLDDVG